MWSAIILFLCIPITYFHPSLNKFKILFKYKIYVNPIWAFLMYKNARKVNITNNIGYSLTSILTRSTNYQYIHARMPCVHHAPSYLIRHYIYLIPPKTPYDEKGGNTGISTHHRLQFQKKCQWSVSPLIPPGLISSCAEWIRTSAAWMTN